MAEVQTQISFNREGFERFLASLSEPNWMTELRREAFELFEKAEWPGRSSEEWSRTDLRMFNLDKFKLLESSGDDLVQATLTEGVEIGGQVVSNNGETVTSTLSEKWAMKGVVFASWDSAIRDHEELVKKCYARRLIDCQTDKFAALQAAFACGGVFAYVPRNVYVSEPLYFLSTIDGGVDLGFTMVVLEEGAEAAVLCEYRSHRDDAAGVHCGAIELLVGPRANLRFVNLQDWGRSVWHFAHQKAKVERDAALQWTIGALGARLAKVNQQVELAGVGANCQVNGVMFTEARQHLAYHTLQHHAAPNTRSDFLYKAALQDQSRTVWQGMIKVDPAAQKTDGYQRNDNLLLSPQARADSIPGLEIEADDVRCTHGSTSGKVEEELIFYAQSRGYTRKEAIQLIVTGFFQQVFDRIPLEAVRDSLSKSIASRVRDIQG